MANFDKFSRGACGHMLKHYERAKDENGEYVRFGNRDIDPERSHLNYNLGPEREGAQYTFIKQRCGEVYCLNRSNVNVLGSWIVTAPEGMPDDQLRPFFQASYDALEKKYGRENVVSAYVHMDESGRPHMHFAFVPVMYDKDKERYSVCAKKLVTKTELKKFHPWLEAEVSQRLGYQVQLMNEATKDGNKTVTELKRERELAKQAEFAQQTEAAKAATAKALQTAQNATQEAERAEARLQDIQEDLNALETPQAVKGVEAKPTMLGGAVKLPREDWELVKSWADRGAAAISYGDNMQHKNEQLQEEVARLEEAASGKMQLLLQNAELQKQVKDLQAENKRLRAFWERIKQQILAKAWPLWEKFVTPAKAKEPEVMNFEDSLAYWRKHDQYMYHDQLQAAAEIHEYETGMGGGDRLMAELMRKAGDSERNIQRALKKRYPYSDLIQQSRGLSFTK